MHAEGILIVAHPGTPRHPETGGAARPAKLAAAVAILALACLGLVLRYRSLTASAGDAPPGGSGMEAPRAGARTERGSRDGENRSATREFRRLPDPESVEGKAMRERMFAELNLTAEQRARLESIEAQGAPQSREDLQKRMEAVRAVLTPEQQSRLRPPGGGGAGGPGGPGALEKVLSAEERAKLDKKLKEKFGDAPPPPPPGAGGPGAGGPRAGDNGNTR